MMHENNVADISFLNQQRATFLFFSFFFAQSNCGGGRIRLWTMDSIFLFLFKMKITFLNPMEETMYILIIMQKYISGRTVLLTIPKM